MPSFYVNSNFYIKEIKGKYYVYLIEKDNGNKRRHNYVGPLDKIIESYIGGVGVSPIIPKCRGRDLNPGHGLERPAFFRCLRLTGLNHRGKSS
ncbi:SSV1-like integrase, N-terminal fragment [Saccharolobus solfataricus]|uniref:SSV1-like integrase, N-terminal n=1 Tax=Saccharolobus solfataricus TaxID=2287 RepID=A0A157SYP1_SACSO|nr:SSV1-like integrase, N-terminal fragment [Saccharolobus solfataricus]